MERNVLFVVNGPNLNLLGRREPSVYGTTTLDEIDGNCRAWGAERGLEVRCFQSNHEGDLVDWVQRGGDEADGIVLNGAAYSHTSVALRDAVAAVSVPVIEVHLSNTAAREAFRHESHLTAVAAGLVMGFGASGYILALQGLKTLLEGK
ncbi:type II 3-dehydroquinate dehydratase [Aminithiophilus ramosus]|uniref:3-dehydroquinate dehydratase n=2 Tax=Synergistales TaxID=649776 RepID=A0A9Q7API9_9BACT|nr:type II 3-dehydroquinate dehydratase [Aminithiophilus ramosus]QTX31791.1 type II 3-dehydroquinate dehydratase [Aminithiophilus ramosus]QVL35613.1 type II 3-dehydroquinate dehydratase [Synergistota bacterium]